MTEDPEELETDEDEEEDDAVVPVVAPTPAAEGAGGEEVESSLDELLAKRAEGETPPEEAEDDSILSLGREERVETLAVKVVPQQPTEFVCKNCFLVKHRSQLADKKRTLCRDCA